MYDCFVNAKKYYYGILSCEEFISIGGVHETMIYGTIYLACSYGVNPYRQGLSRENIEFIRCFEDRYVMSINDFCRCAYDYIIISKIISDLREEPVEEIEVGSLFFFR